MDKTITIYFKTGTYVIFDKVRTIIEREGALVFTYEKDNDLRVGAFGVINIAGYTKNSEGE
jgi:hypothetical protein